MTPLESLLQQCTVKIIVPGGWGTGFFVAPGLILTCAHVVRKAVALPITVVYTARELSLSAIVKAQADDCKTLDLALVELIDPLPGHPCVLLDEEPVALGQALYSYGYLESYTNAAPVRPVNEGLTGDTPPLLKLKDAQIEKGISGAALLNLKTGKVCGMVKETRAARFDLGGGAIPTRVILEQFPELRTQQKEFHQQDGYWTNLIKANRKITDYINKVIEKPLDDKILSGTNDEKISLRHLYVPLEIQEINQEGILNDDSFDSHAWVKNLLLSDDREHIILIQGDSGQGKTALCRMLASEIFRESSLDFIPVFIQFQSLDKLNETLIETFRPCLQTHEFFVENGKWLTDSEQKFLIILDGFDEVALPLEEVQKLIEQIIEFQRDTQNQFLLTSRSLASQETEKVFGGYGNILSGQIQRMKPSLQSQWIDNWSIAISDQNAGEEFRVFLEGDPGDLTRPGCPKDIRSELAGEPLSLYLLASLFHSGDIGHKDFIGADEAEGRVKIYQRALEKALQRVAKSKLYKQLSKKRKLSGSVDLEPLLMETALCIVHSNSESVSFSTIKRRFEDGLSPVKKWIDESLQDADPGSGVSKLVNSFLTSFYVCLGRQSNDTSLRFVHKSFGEFLFAKKLKQAILESFYLKKERKEIVYKSIYGLIGHGELTREIVQYFTILIFQENSFTSSFDEFKKFFTQFYEFYWDWSEDNKFFKPSTPESIVEGESGFRSRDIYVVLNVVILLLELYRYARFKEYSLYDLPFHLCEKKGETQISDIGKLLRLVGYSYFLNRRSQEYNSDENFVRIVGSYLEKVNLFGAKLTGVNLSNADLRGAVLSQSDLKRANLLGADLRGADLSGARLQGCDLREAKLDGANLSDADLEGANLSNLDFTKINYPSKSDNYPSESDNLKSNPDSLKGVNLNFANLSKVRLVGVQLQSSKLTNLILDNLDLSNADLQGADLSYSSFRNANLENATLQDANLQNTSFRNANLCNAIFGSREDFSKLENQSLENQGSIDDEQKEIDSSYEDKEYFVNTDFSGANLQRADFEGLDLTGTNFECANLKDVNFKDAILEEVNFLGADLTNANLENAYLGKADLRNAILQYANLSGSSMKNIKYNKLTDWQNALGLEDPRDVPPIDSDET